MTHDFAPNQAGGLGKLVNINEALSMAAARADQDVHDEAYSAVEVMLRALRDGELVAYALASPKVAYKIPSRFWSGDWSDACLSGQMYAPNFLSSFPPFLRDTAVKVVGKEFERWLGDPVATDQKFPPVSSAALRTWWDSAGKQYDEAQIDEAGIIALARQAFPTHQISRDRIREMRGPKKRGPKRFGGNPTAE